MICHISVLFFRAIYNGLDHSFGGERHDIDCWINRVGTMKLKSEFAKKSDPLSGFIRAWS